MIQYSSGDKIGLYRVIGSYPGGGYRAVHITRYDRARIDVRSLCDDWREHAVQLLRASTLLGVLDHPGIARIVDRGVLPDRRPWLATELAEGVVLSELLARRTLAVEETLALVRDLASIMVNVHANNLVHGAIHPHAIVMRTGERRFPIQLGAWSELRTAGTDVEEIPLTPYAARDARFDAKSDIYSIGVLAYRGLTGRFPIINPPELIAGVPGPVSALIVKLLAPDPADRPDAKTIYTGIVDLVGDREMTGPRFARPRWTPVPDTDTIPTESGLPHARTSPAHPPANSALTNLGARRDRVK